FELNKQWHDAMHGTRFIELFSAIDDPALEPSWRRQIRAGASMLGRSMMSLDLADAFLCNIIGLETLLTRRGERNGGRLAARIKGLTGWHLRNHRQGYEAEIMQIHNVRCDIV